MRTGKYVMPYLYLEIIMGEPIEQNLCNLKLFESFFSNKIGEAKSLRIIMAYWIRNEGWMDLDLCS